MTLDWIQARGHSHGRVNVTIRGRSAGGREEPLAIQPCSSTGFADYLLQGAIILAVTVAKISLSHKSTTLMERKTKTWNKGTDCSNNNEHEETWNDIQL